ncbi:MAG: serine/threonine-protein phosphatase [Pirellulaceae bacterium]|nr:serine/threonine-protein phosphatase [Pirellulaceae bacterium]
MLTGGTSTSSTLDSDQLQCMEVWGGNRGIERYFRLPGLEIWLYSRPYDEAASGGDVYYLSSCASGRITRLLLADVSGHGVAVSQCASRLRDLMRKHINRVSQQLFVAEINKDFTGLGEGNFATALVGTFFASTRSLQLSTAGHPHPILFRDKSCTWEICDPGSADTTELSDLPLGIVEGVEYCQSRLTLGPGDMLLAYTDGVTEMRLSNDRQLNSAGLLSLAQAMSGTAPAAFLSKLVERLRKSSSEPMGDDMTMLLLRADGTGTSWRNNLLAPFRLLRGARNKVTFRQT